MNLDITAEWLLSFEADEPMGLMTFGDRKELERRSVELSIAPPAAGSVIKAMRVERSDSPAPIVKKPRRRAKLLKTK